MDFKDWQRAAQTEHFLCKRLQAYCMCVGKMLSRRPEKNWNWLKHTARSSALLKSVRRAWPNTSSLPTRRKEMHRVIGPEQTKTVNASKRTFFDWTFCFPLASDGDIKINPQNPKPLSLKNEQSGPWSCHDGGVPRLRFGFHHQPELVSFFWVTEKWIAKARPLALNAGGCSLPLMVFFLQLCWAMCYCTEDFS